MSLIRKAKRSNIPLKLAIVGGPGSGKSYSSLLLAKGLMGDSFESVCMLDTENESGDLYDDIDGSTEETTYNILPFKGPWPAERYIKAIEICEQQGIKCLIIDSLSHEWSKDGGVVDSHSKMTGNSFVNWAKAKDGHKKLMDKILQSKMHIICTMRSKVEYVIEQNEKGKATPRKVGTKAIQEDDSPYEFTIVFDVNFDHNAVVSKDRSQKFSQDVPFRIGKDTGDIIRKWNKM